MKKTGLVSSLVRNGRNDKGKTRLKQDVENVIEAYYLKMQRPSRAATFREVKRVCVARCLQVPDSTTVRIQGEAYSGVKAVDKLYLCRH